MNVASDFYCQIPNEPPHKVGQGGARWGLVGVCHIARGGGLVTMTVTNSHLAPPMPIWGVVGHKIDRCIRGHLQTIFVRLTGGGGGGGGGSRP